MTTSDHSKGRLLIADEKAEACRSLGDSLRLQGHEVLQVQDGPAALEMAIDLRPDVVILSSSLPGMSGAEVCERLQLEEETQGMPVLLISESDSPIARKQSIEVGAVDHLALPFDSEAFSFQVGNLVRMQRRHRKLESNLLKMERRERLRDEWVAYTVQEINQTLGELPEETPAIRDVRVLTQNMVDCRQMSHPKALVSLQTCDLAEMASRFDAEAEDFQGKVEADPGILNRLLSQLVSAAQIQCSEHNRPILSAKKHCEDQVTIEVEVTGSGIWHESYATLDQGSATSQGLDCQSPLELSLAFCKHAIDLMGGSIGVDATPGDSLRFWFSLPSAAPEVRPNIIPFVSEEVAYDTAASR